MSLFLDGARFTQKARHISENPLKSDLLTYFKTKFNRMTTALPAFFGLNPVYREILFRDRNLLIDYLHIPVKQRNKFLTYSRVELEQKLLTFIDERNERVYNEKYLPHMETMMKIENDNIFDTRRRLMKDYESRFDKYYRFDYYSDQEFLSFLEKYKQEYKKTLYLPPNYSPKKECEVKVKVDKPKEKFVQIEESPLARLERQEKQHEEYLEKEKQKKLEKVRQEREKEKAKKKLDMMLVKKKKR